MLCLTATLTRVDQLHLIELLHFNPTIIQASPYRPNLFFRLVPVSDVGKTDQVILSAIFREVLDSIEDDAKSVGTTVVFCRSYASVIRVYEWLEEELTRRGALYFPREKHTAEYRVLGQYHGVTDERVKLEVLARIGKSIKLLVCTSAFGKSSLTVLAYRCLSIWRVV
jgi:superfamily II DNA helicase RecQ